jgi:hypothetical protein
MDDRVPIEARDEPSSAGVAVKVFGMVSLLAIAGISLFSVVKILHT